MENAAELHSIKSEPEQDRLPEDTWDVPWSPSSGPGMLLCGQCSFVSPPRPLRLHQLLGCCSNVPTDTRLSIQSSQRSDKSLPKTLPLCDVRLQKISNNGEVKLSLPSCLPCNFCRFRGQPRTLRLHYLLGCCAAIVDADKSSQLGLKVDSSSHSEKKSYNCNVCDYKCRFLCHLKRHNLTHTGEKPYSCKICSFKCSQSNTLKTHILMHTGEKPFSCTVCSYKCNDMGNLKKHNLKHSGEKPFCCKLCSYKSFDSSSLKRHQYTHTGEKPYSCKVCSYKCSKMCNLKRHCLTHNKNKLDSSKISST